MVMSKIVPGLYVGSYRDSVDQRQLEDNRITHILTILEIALKDQRKDKEYLFILASDTPSQDLTRFFPKCNDFIHRARLSGGAVLVHCYQGMSRSVTVAAAYLMTVTSLGWKDAITAIREARRMANPNEGFQRQLQKYEVEKLEKARKLLKEKYPSSQFTDEQACRQLCSRARERRKHRP